MNQNYSSVACTVKVDENIETSLLKDVYKYELALCKAHGELGLADCDSGPSLPSHQVFTSTSSKKRKKFQICSCNYMIVIFYQLCGVAQHSKIPTGCLYLLHMGLQVGHKFWSAISALLRFGNMKSLEMSRLIHSL